MSASGTKRRKIADGITAALEPQNLPLKDVKNSTINPFLSGERENNDTDDGEELSCTICCYPWTSDGEHRICCLPCGHIFGRSCVEKWILTQRNCPQCKMKTNVKDLRNLFVNKVIAMDSIERQQLKEALDAERISRAKAQQTASSLQTQLKASEMRLSLLKAEYDALQASVQSGQSSKASGTKPYQSPFHSIASITGINIRTQKSIPSLIKSRVVEYVQAERWILASTQPRSSAQFGLRRFSAVDPSAFSDEFDLGHSESVRDMRISPSDSKILLTTSTDRSIRLTNLQSKNCVLAITQQPTAFWACCWDEIRPNYCYCGTQTGGILVFDIRQTKSAVMSLTAQHREPIHSLLYSKSHSALLSGSMGGIYTWEIANMFEPRVIDHSAAVASSGVSATQFKCVGLDYDDTSSLIAASFRSSDQATPDCAIIARLANGEPSMSPSQEKAENVDSESSINISFGVSEPGFHFSDSQSWSLPTKSSTLSRPSIMHQKDGIIAAVATDVGGVRILSPGTRETFPVNLDASSSILHSKLLSLDRSNSISNSVSLCACSASSLSFVNFAVN